MLEAAAHGQQRWCTSKEPGANVDQPRLADWKKTVACSTDTPLGVRKHTSAGCKYGCGVSRGIISRKSTMRCAQLKNGKGEKSQPMSMPYSSSSFKLWFDQYC